MKRNQFIKLLPAAVSVTAISRAKANVPSEPAKREITDRDYWVKVLDKIASPVLGNLSQRTLKKNLVYEGKVPNRISLTYLEAFGRLLAGMAPWLELGPDESTEGRLRQKYITQVRLSLDAATDPASPDYMDFTRNVATQPLVDTAFLAHGLIRGYTQLWQPLDSKVKTQVVKAFKLTREMKPGNNNWVLFSAMVEAFLLKAGEEYNESTMTNAVALLNQWYKGDGHYGDGPSFHADYYNSFVMHPMLLDVAKELKNAGKETEANYQLLLTRARRYAEVQERLISPEGAFPVIGRSLAYRFGAFQALAQIALMKQLPKEVEPAQVRGALTAIIRRSIEARGTFSKEGWLNIGFCGHQKNIGEGYITTGSVYLCTVGLLPLGLPAADPFWSDPPKDWTSKKAWAGIDLPADHAINQ